jgi:KaiC/GvpD/RAD55 family RecA-like ATPase
LSGPPTLPEPIDWGEFWAEDHGTEDWLLDPVLPRGRSIALYSPAKTGKSLLALDLAVRLATGQRVLDRPAGNPEHVIYLDMEMSPDDLHERLEDMGYGPEWDLSHLHYYSLPSLPPLDSPSGGMTLLALAQRHAAALTVIDTTSRVIAGEENSADTIRAFYMFTGLPLRAEGITVLRLDHAGKSLEQGQRGSSAKNDDVDLVWQMTATDDGVKLRATHRRQAWIPETVDLIRLEEPLRHERAAQAWPSGTADLAAELDALGVPLTAPIRKCAEALRIAGKPARTAAITAAQRWRKNSGNAPGNTGSYTSGKRSGKHRETESGNAPGNTGNTPPDKWETPPVSIRETGVSQSLFCPEPGCLQGVTEARPCPTHHVIYAEALEASR